MRLSSPFSVVAWLLVLFSLAPASVAAQQPAPVFRGPDWQVTPMLGIGYVANAPSALLGGTGYVFRPLFGGFGLLVDFKITHQSFEDEHFEPDITVQQAQTVFNDPFVWTHEHWYSASVGVARPINSQVAFYGGAGLARMRVFREFEDVSLTRGAMGIYRVEDEDASATGVNVMGGALFRIGTLLTLRFGVESAPRGFTVGGALLFPNR